MACFDKASSVGQVLLLLLLHYHRYKAVDAVDHLTALDLPLAFVVGGCNEAVAAAYHLLQHSHLDNEA